MDPPFSHWRNEGSKPYLSALLELPQGGGGIDWLQATGYGYCLGHLFDKLTKVKEHLHQNGETWGVVQLDPGDTKSIAMIADASDGKGFSRQPFIIKWEEIVVAFGATKESNGTRPICTLRITGSPLLKFGEGGVLKRAARLLKWLGIEAEFKPSRIDFCVDLPGVKVSEFVDAWKEGSGVVSKCKDMQLIYNGQEPSGMISKSNRVRMTVYDKRLEVLTRSPDKLNDMMEKRWGGLPDHATRVEFQVYLSKFDAERKPQSLEDCIGHSWRLFSWLSLKWFRLTTGEVDRTHTTRAPIHPVWRLTFKAAELVFARLNTKLPDTIPREVSDEALRAQWFGLTAAFMARMECANPIEFLREVAPALVLEPFLTKLEKQFGKRGISLREVYGESEGVPIDNNGSW